MGPKSTSTDAPDEQESSTLSPGDLLIDRYRVTERLGSGGYGEVLAARELPDKRRVAIKLLNAEAGKRDPAALARMRQEAEILDAIDHPNIVEIYDVGQSDHGEFIVMELLEGQSIEEILESEGPAEPERVAPLVEQLLAALSAAHQKKVLHRDLKPENILLVDAPDGPHGEVAKLVDFGIAKAGQILDDDPDEGVTLVKTRGGGFVGTPRYCSPEAAVGDPTAPSADLFSLGLVVAEWLTGTPRIGAVKQNAVLSELIQPEPLDVSDCPPNWQPWLARMIAKRPEERYDSADDALIAFRTLVRTDGEEEDMAQTIEQRRPEALLTFGDASVSETAETNVRVPPAPDALAPRDHATETAPDTTTKVPAGDPAAEAQSASLRERDAGAGPQTSEDESTGLSWGRLFLIAAASCGAMLLLLLLLRTLFS